MQTQHTADPQSGSANPASAHNLLDTPGTQGTASVDLRAHDGPSIVRLKHRCPTHSSVWWISSMVLTILLGLGSFGLTLPAFASSSSAHGDPAPSDPCLQMLPTNPLSTPVAAATDRVSPASILDSGGNPLGILQLLTCHGSIVGRVSSTGPAHPLTVILTMGPNVSSATLNTPKVGITVQTRTSTDGPFSFIDSPPQPDSTWGYCVQGIISPLAGDGPSSTATLCSR